MPLMYPAQGEGVQVRHHVQRLEAEPPGSGLQLSRQLPGSCPPADARCAQRALAPDNLCSYRAQHGCKPQPQSVPDKHTMLQHALQAAHAK